MGKQKIRMEFAIKASPNLIYPYLSTPGGLSEWFCDDVDIKNDTFKFKWNNDIQEARVLKKVPNKMIRFHWIDSEQEEFFEFELEKDEITDDIALVVFDFSEAGEEKELERLWESQVNDLRHALGA